MDFGAELRRRRIAAGLSLAGLAALAHYSRGHLSKVETGHTVASTELARQCDRVLRADGALVAMAMALSGHKLESSGRASGQRPGGADASAAQHIAGGGDRSSAWDVPAVPAGLVHVAPVTTEQAESTLEVFSVFFDQLRGLGQRFYSGALLRTLIAQAETLQGLAMSAGNRERALLLELAARYALYAGWMAQEAGDDYAAIHWTGKRFTSLTPLGSRKWPLTRWSGGRSSACTGAMPRRPSASRSRHSRTSARLTGSRAWRRCTRRKATR